MEYLTHVPTTVPAGKVLVHNHVTPRKTLGMGGFRAWLDDPAARYEPCPCGWAPHLAEHYRVRERRGS